uniref:Uncharacterized protein n=1 Tax=Rhizophora mucronata TaxID=61149 RepID=A0A2P2NSS3_RHIMU
MRDEKKIKKIQVEQNLVWKI